MVTRKRPSTTARKTITHDVTAILASLQRMGVKRMRDNIGPRYGITGPTAANAFGVPVGKIRDMGKRLGRNHKLALALWKTGQYEARLLASFVDEPAHVTPAQMERWAREFDNWAICDTVCFHNWDRTPHALSMVRQWSRRKEEFVKRAAFALLACVALHGKKTTRDAALEKFLPLIERAAMDNRNFVKKGVSWALRAIGRRRPSLKIAAVEVARRLADSPDLAARWVGKDALKDFG